MLIIALAAQGWNLLGGVGGQSSFGHAAFFGTGAYVTAILQVRYGVNAWAALAAGIAMAALVGWIIGFLSFRSGLRGSYFALVTLAFAEVLPHPRQRHGLYRWRGGPAAQARSSARQFPILQPRPVPLDRAWACRAGTGDVERIAASRFGARLVAVRENEDAAKALGVDVLEGEAARDRAVGAR